PVPSSSHPAASPIAAARPIAAAQPMVDHRAAAIAPPSGSASAAPRPAPAPATLPGTSVPPLATIERATAVMVATPPAAPTPTGDPVRTRVLAIIAEKTGYPPDMLDDGLDLEADLGVDTVKQAETFAAVRAAYDIPRQEDLKLRDFPTIAHVVGFVYAHRPDLARPPRPAMAGAASTQAPATTTLAGTSGPPGPAATTVIAAAPWAPAPTGDDAVRARVLAIIAEKTGY